MLHARLELSSRNFIEALSPYCGDVEHATKVERFLVASERERSKPFSLHYHQELFSGETI